jgi:hypothetical protein
MDLRGSRGRPSSALRMRSSLETVLGHLPATTHHLSDGLQKSERLWRES